ncbi:hypothetical protein TWF106_009798 [Orbilia oligospora]|uniref:Uncharacterized protein n=1 Tax=Orbilia oligospora TaxID=2813651 RepID=A0A6G1MD38_ORBOL|nr:hypothetical protein TWF679_007923 [Orbilia oligospora]KAF3212428.1 hypothetical protein TWF106_009798 [Orbilia oligospora]KAF3217766.1 hypothetical protein TWF191_008397 [Orbilia oligospora]KAF3254433.1 hypothetical protein TWF192_003194 [Orbilia oligospora]
MQLQFFNFILSILPAFLTVTNAIPAYSIIGTAPGVIQLPRSLSSTSTSISGAATANQTTKDTPQFTNWPPPSPRNINIKQNVHGDEIPYTVLPVLHPDILCVPVGDFEVNSSSGDCVVDTFCSPFNHSPVHMGRNNTINTSPSSSTLPIQQLKGKYKPRQRRRREEPPETIYAITLPGPTIPIYFPTAIIPPSHTSHQLQYFPPGAHPWYEYSTITIPPTPTIPNFNSQESHTQTPSHPSSQSPLQKPCRIPKIYEGICHPLVIPSVVIAAYFLSTFILYSGDPSKPVSPVYNYQPAPQPLPRPLNPYIPYFYHQQRQQTPIGSYIYPPVATVGHSIRRNLLCLTNFFCGGTEDPQLPLPHRPGMLNVNINERMQLSVEIERSNQNACYFLTTFLTYGAGLIILGSFLGGLCNCVKTECEFM